jgi:Tfp pilus assembly protein FimT
MRRNDSAFTIVELLVVAALMAVLFGLVLAGGRPKPSARKFAQEFASMLLAAQSRALGRPEGAAVIIELPRTGITDDPLRIHEAVCLPPIVLNAPDGTLANSGNTDLNQGYKVRFQSKSGSAVFTVSPWLKLSGGVPQARDAAGQNERNTIVQPTGANLEAVVVRLPVIGGKAIAVPKQLAMRLENSGVGDDPAASHGFVRLDGKGALAVVFDQAGRVADVVSNVTGPTAPDSVSPGELIYFFFHEVDLSQTPPPDPLQSDRSIWVAINPQTGRINIAANKPGTLFTARENARKAIAVGK